LEPTPLKVSNCWLTDTHPPVPTTQCDEGKPTCERCKRSGRECLGYRAEFDRVHRDQTRSTLRRMMRPAAAAAAAAAATAAPASLLRRAQRGPPAAAPPTAQTTNLIFIQENPSSFSSPSSSSSASPAARACHLPSPDRSPSPPRLSAAIGVPLVQRAACHFAANFILVPRAARSSTGGGSRRPSGGGGFMDYLVPLIDTALPGTPLRLAFDACAYALLANRATAAHVDLGKLALREHTLALGQTHKALGRPGTADSDETLAAVLLMRLYEVCCFLPSLKLCFDFFPEMRLTGRMGSWAAWCDIAC